MYIIYLPSYYSHLLFHNFKNIYNPLKIILRCKNEISFRFKTPIILLILHSLFGILHYLAMASFCQNML
jgi:hypothetical protein